jgi:predicted metal-binding protein
MAGKKYRRYSPSWGHYWEVSDLVGVREKDVQASSIVFTEKAREWCKLPYPMPKPDHPRGCPNYGKNPLCPPNSPYRADILVKFKKFKIVYAVFDFKRYKELVREQHPAWSDRQVENVLYWQSAVKKVLKQRVFGDYHHVVKGGAVLCAGSGFENCQSMESGGIDVFASLKNNDIPIERHPENVVTLVALVAWNDPKPERNKHPSLLDFMAKSPAPVLKVPGTRLPG